MTHAEKIIKRMRDINLTNYEFDMIKNENEDNLYPISTMMLHKGIPDLMIMLWNIDKTYDPDNVPYKIRFKYYDSGKTHKFTESIDDKLCWMETDDTVSYPTSYLALRMTKFAILNYLAKNNKIYVPEDKFPEEYYDITYGPFQTGEKPDYEISHNGIICYKIQAKQIGKMDELLDCPVIQLMRMTAEVPINKKAAETLSRYNIDNFMTHSNSGSSDAKEASNYKIEQKEKERKNMFNEKFGKVRGNTLALSYDGKIAVKNGNEDYVRYNAETSTVENIKDFVVNNNKFFFIMPVSDVAEGDIIKYNDGFYQVTKVNEANIAAINLKNSTMATIVRETIFGMQFYAKVISLIDPSTFGKDNNGMMAMMMLGDEDMDIKELMMLQMMTNGNKGGQANQMMMMLLMDDDMGGDDDMLSTMLMMNMMNGGNGFDMGNMSQNPMMMMLLLKDGNGGKMDKMMKFMLMSQMMNNQKAVEPAKEEKKEKKNK